MAGNHNDFGWIVELSNLLQRVEPVDSRKPDVEEDDVEAVPVKQFEACLSRVNRGGGIIFILKDARQTLADTGFVVDDQNVMHVEESLVSWQIREQPAIR